MPAATALELIKTRPRASKLGKWWHPSEVQIMHNNFATVEQSFKTSFLSLCPEHTTIRSRHLSQISNIRSSLSGNSSWSEVISEVAKMSPMTRVKARAVEKSLVLQLCPRASTMPLHKFWLIVYRQCVQYHFLVQFV